MKTLAPLYHGENHDRGTGIGFLGSTLGDGVDLEIVTCAEHATGATGGTVGGERSYVASQGTTPSSEGTHHPEIMALLLEALLSIGFLGRVP